MLRIKGYRWLSFTILLIMFAVIPILTSEAQNFDVPCEALPWSNSILTEESGSLLTISGSFDDGDTVHSTSDDFTEMTSESRSILLSPDGNWLLSRQIDEEKFVFTLINLQDNTEYEMMLSSNYEGTIRWISAPKILITRVTVGMDILPFVIMDIPNQTLTHIFSPNWRQLGSEILALDTTALMPESYNIHGVPFGISPDGRYLHWRGMDGEIFYDIETRQETLFISSSDYFVSDFVWSQDSETLIFMNRKDDVDQYFIFDISENEFQKISDLDHNAYQYFDIEDDSLSPNNEYLAIRMTPSLSEPSVLNILNTTNLEIYSSCVTNTEVFREFDFAWSHDSRFLAFQGMLGEYAGIYIYDIVENQVYEFERRNRGLIGWSSVLSQN